MATVTPTIAFMRRLIPAIVILAVLLAACAIGFNATQHLGWFAGVGIGVIGFAAWTLYLMAMHRDEWRWYDGTPGAGKKT